MNLYLLDRTGTIDYDEYYAFLIRANDEWEARNLAASRAADEGEEIWFNPSTTCVLLTDTITPDQDGSKAEILMKSFAAG